MIEEKVAHLPEHPRCKNQNTERVLARNMEHDRVRYDPFYSFEPASSTHQISSFFSSHLLDMSTVGGGSGISEHKYCWNIGAQILLAAKEIQVCQYSIRYLFCFYIKHSPNHVPLFPNICLPASAIALS